MSARRLAKRRDPATSHDAAREHVRSGRYAHNLLTVHRLLLEYGPMTASELRHRPPAYLRRAKRGRVLDVVEIRRRLSDLKARGVIDRAGHRRPEDAKGKPSRLDER